MLLALHLTCFAAEPAHLLSDYTHTAWGGLQGAPVDVLKFTQTTDGWLWIATATGLYRYDGAGFQRADSVYGYRLHSSNVLGLKATRDGALWVGYRLGGVSVLRKGGSRSYFEADGLPGGAVFHIEAAPDGTIWVAARDGVASLRPGARRFDKQGAAVGLPDKRMFQILFARDGTQWVASLAGVHFRRPGEQMFRHAWPRKTLMAMAEGPDGSLWAADEDNKYYRVRTTAPASAGEVQPELAGTGMWFDKQGQMWLLQLDGLERKFDLRAAPNPAQQLTLRNGLSGSLPQTFFQDREGNLWFGTSAGLDRLRRNRLKSLPVPAPLDRPAMVAGPDRDVWVGDFASQVRSFTADGVKKVELQSRFATSHRAPDGSLWIGAERGLHRRAPDGRFETITPPERARGFDPQAIHQDSSGALWVSYSDGSLYRRVGSEWIRNGGLQGFPASMAMAMEADAEGRLWMGHANNEISLVDAAAGGAVRRLGAADGLKLGTLLDLYQDGERMWLGGERGTALYRAGRFAMLRGRGNEAFRGVSGIVRLPGGELWLHGADGIYRIGAGELAAWMADPGRLVEFEHLGALDGLHGTASQLRPTPSLIKAPDGQLWFATGSAIAILDPARIPRNHLPPPVEIHTLASEGRQYRVADGLPVSLPKGSDKLQIAFTALSLAMPERVRLRYRLEGVDRDWQEANGRREATYTNLAPGNYVFRVIAANEDGLWNERGAALDIEIPPTFVQTRWFTLLLVLAAALLLYIAHALRVRNLTLRMQERLAERARIARALHDTLLQSVQALILTFHNHLPNVAPGSRERARLENSLDLADRLLIEGREQIMELRTASDPDALFVALRDFGASLAANGPETFEARVTGRHLPLQARVHNDVLAVAREALFNATRYAQAAHITLTMHYGEQAFTLRISDDGRGLADAVARLGSRPGHWGLVGMRERAACIGATLSVISEPGQGTEVELTVPARLAYEGPEGRRSQRAYGRWWPPAQLLKKTAVLPREE